MSDKHNLVLLSNDELMDKICVFLKDVSKMLDGIHDGRWYGNHLFNCSINCRGCKAKALLKNIEDKRI